uniref:RWP-RK domain-containing protein n=1 Tax=Hanusia phi TaxID=3032 RepID=A0A7S0F1T5_9CRYP
MVKESFRTIQATNRMMTPRETRIVPRRKAGEFGASTSAKDAITLTERDIVSLFSLRQGDAARHLGISLTALKAACRRLGVPKWPYLRAHCVEQQNNEKGSSSEDLLAFFDAQRPRADSSESLNLLQVRTTSNVPGEEKRNGALTVGESISFGLNTLELESLLQEALCHVESRRC